MDVQTLRMIIADDERRICALIRGLLDWESLGIKIIGETYSGTSVLQMIEELRPDIVITDICMPGLNGLDMIHRVQEAGIPCEFILISGHKNFEYAHSAIKYGIRNYMLKPLNEEDLRGNVLNVRERILESRTARSSFDSAMLQVARGKEISEKMLMQDLLSGRLGKTQYSAAQLRAAYNLDFCDGVFLSVALKPITKVKLTDAQYNIVQEKVDIFFREKLTKNGVHFCSILHEECVCFVINGAEPKYVRSNLADIFDEAKAYFVDYCILSGGVSAEGAGLSCRMAEMACTALLFRLDRRDGMLIDYTEAMEQQCGETQISEQGLAILCREITVVNPNGVQSWFAEHLFGEFCTGAVSAPDFFAGIRQTVAAARGELEQLRWEQPDGVGKTDVLRVVDRLGSRVEIIRTVENWLIDILGEYAAQKSTRQGWYVREAKVYARENYARNISLSDISEQLHINATYFSALFKREEGITFSDYIISCRMDAAKTLLKTTNQSISEIGQQVGYDDVSYFSKMFKKVVGIRPKEYRKLYL